MTTTLTLLAAGILLAAGVHCIRRVVQRLRAAARLVDGIRREQADDTTPEQAAEEAVDRGLDRLFTALGPPPEPTPADRTPVGDDDWTRDMHRRIRHTAKRRNTGPRPRQEEL